MYKLFTIVALAAIFSSCGGSKHKESQQDEDRIAKEKLQGIWLEETTESPLLQVKGDTIFYADASTAPVAFKIMGDTLKTFGERTNNYLIEKQGDYTFWFRSAVGDMIRLHKAENDVDSLAFTQNREMHVYNEVVKKDSVVSYNNTRYRGYVYINPSKIKVMRPGVSEEGMGVDNVYYDNIIHICVYEGKKSLFATDIKKQMFDEVIPKEFLQWAILSDMDFYGVDSRGYHYQATVCIPDDASCYLVNITVNPEGKLSYELVR